MNNPFSISFGKNPYTYIERVSEMNDVYDILLNSYNQQQVCIITSVRGSGKTVLMTNVSKCFEIMEEWTVIELNPNLNLLESLLSKLSSKFGSIIKSLNINLTILGAISVGGNIKEKISDYETAIITILEKLKAQGKKVLITIDEVTKNENMTIFASSFQIFMRKDLPIFLLMTGLYENIKNIQDEKTLTFLYRAPRIILKPLNTKFISKIYKETFNLTNEETLEMADLTKGYAFAFQLLGYLTFKNNGKYKEVINEYQGYLEEYSYDKIWSELSNNDRKILLAITKSNDVSSIMYFANMKNNQFNPYRKRLINKGLVDGSIRGKLYITLPLFDKYIIENS